jgi:5-methylcytosine-specific restriction enzyme subunit McrC
MRVESIQESRDTELPLTPVEAMHLDALGKRLTSETTWWGETDEEDGNTFERTVIRVRRTPAGSWTVRVSDAVGVIAIPGLQITVKPKIPLGHLLYMLGQVDVLPRLDEERTEIEQSTDLFELTARWFLSAAEQLVRLGLIRDYEPERSELSAVRGRLEPLNTALLYYSGHLAFDCEYEDFTYNTPLNRVIRAAAHALLASPLLPKHVRARAMQVTARIEEADDLRPGDIRVKVDRRTVHYREPVLLAKTIIQSLGRTPLAGGHIGWTFLIRTPEAVEHALRLFLAEALPDRSVDKTRLQLTGTALTISPDLVFSAPLAVGDVKYKLSAGEWIRSDLYQLVAFATGFRVQHALLVRFREPVVLTCRDLMVGEVHVSERTWPADPLIPAATAAGQFVDGVRGWIAGCALPGAHGDKQLLTA